ncbi:MAG: DUF1015 family protein [Calditrichia bacterium]
MAVVRPFKAVRPRKELAEKVAAPPYDVLDSKEAREMAKDNPYSFLHINKPEIDLPEDVNLYDEAVYQKGKENFEKFMKEGILVQDDQPCFYIYKQVMGSHSQIGLVAAASVEDYENDIIKKHELTREDKENDRLKHIETLSAQTGPVFLTYPAKNTIDSMVEHFISNNEPEYDFVSEDKFATVRHTFWVIKDADIIEALIQEFSQIPYLYVADGHHRSAAATRYKQKRQKENANHTGNEEYNFFLTVIFPHNQMQILDYNRVVKDLNGMSKEEFLKKLEELFVIESNGNNAYKPVKAHEFGMYLDNTWYKLTAKEGVFNPNDPVDRLDVNILQKNVLHPMLGIENPRKDKRIDFVGGIRGMSELEKRVNSGDWALAFSLFPTSIEDLMIIADAGLIMPPKSTWFEPKLKSGVAIHLVD